MTPWKRPNSGDNWKVRCFRVWGEEGTSRKDTEDFEAVKVFCILYKDGYAYLSKFIECTVLGYTRARLEDAYL